MLNEIFKTAIVLFALIDPLGTIPVYLEATKLFDERTKKKIALRAVLTAGGVLVFFVLFGQIILEAMDISLNAFQVSGGVVLFLFSLTMIFGEGKPEGELHMIKDYTHVTTFPLAIPSIASPGAIMGLVLLTDNHRYTFAHQLFTTIIMAIILGMVYVLLRIADKIQAKVGENWVNVISRVMGLIIASVAVESILSGLKHYFQ